MNRCVARIRGPAHSRILLIQNFAMLAELTVKNPLSEVYVVFRALRSFHIMKRSEYRSNRVRIRPRRAPSPPLRDMIIRTRLPQRN